MTQGSTPASTHASVDDRPDGTTRMPPAAEARHEVTVRVNGISRSAAVPARRLLSDFLRHDLRLTGTHVGCEHGVCGACTVLLDGRPVRSCLMFAVQATGHEITTVEGLATASPAKARGAASTANAADAADAADRANTAANTAPNTAPDTVMSPVQQAFIECHGLQCGFCTPGFLTTVTAYLEEHPRPTAEEAREAISGNLCRCTGYQNIVKSVLRAAQIKAEIRAERAGDPAKGQAS
jgi:carbon-monoxide dehydrogenase small subunit